MRDHALTYLISLSHSNILPIDCWTLATWRVAHHNYNSMMPCQEKVHEILIDTIKEQLGEKLKILYHQNTLQPSAQRRNLVLDTIAPSGDNTLQHLQQIYDQFMDLSLNFYLNVLSITLAKESNWQEILLFLS